MEVPQQKDEIPREEMEMNKNERVVKEEMERNEVEDKENKWIEGN